VAPTSITPETGFEPTARVDIVPGLVGIENGAVGLDAAVGNAAPPPPPPGPKPPVPWHSGITAPRKVFDVSPKYPELARAARVEGIVIIEATIDATGKVESARILRSKEPLDQAALDAVLQWRFTPALLNGEPIPVVMTVTVNFKLQ
jgi:protein TonB